MPGRKPLTLDDARRKRLLDALALGATIRLAAAACGVSEDTLARWRKANPALQADMDAAEAQGAVQALSVIKQAAASGTWQAAAWLLERRYPLEFGRTTPQAREDVTQGQAQSDPVADARLARIVEETAARLAAAVPDGGAIAQASIPTPSIPTPSKRPPRSAHLTPPLSHLAEYTRADCADAKN
jgi:hypothetical protein